MLKTFTIEIKTVKFKGWERVCHECCSRIENQHQYLKLASRLAPDFIYCMKCVEEKLYPYFKLKMDPTLKFYE